jgi:hypothetical protein
MKQFTIIFLLVSSNLFSQISFRAEFDELKTSFKKNSIDINDVDVENENLNLTELKILKILYDSSENFENKAITFITGPAGTTISTKTSFFKSFKDRYLINDIIPFTIIKLEEKERLLSTSDYLIFFWVKTSNPKSKKLLRKIKNHKL